MSSFWLILKQQWTIKISSTLFLFLAWWLSWLEVGITGHNFGRGPSKDHSTIVWFKLAQWLQRSWLKCEKLTDGCSVVTIAHLTLWVRWAKNSTNQKQELPVVAMFVNGSRWNDQLKCEKLTRTDAKWWQKLTLPLARWAKMLAHYIQRISWVTYIRINET